MEKFSDYCTFYIAHNSCPELIVDYDPSTIQYHSTSNFLDQFNILPTLRLLRDSDLKPVNWLGGFRYVSLVDSTNARYVRKSIDPDRPETLKDWENEFLKLTCRQESPYIVDLVGITTGRNPYSREGEDVVTAFLLEYGRGGTLKDFIRKLDDVSLSRWIASSCERPTRHASTRHYSRRS